MPETIKKLIMRASQKCPTISPCHGDWNKSWTWEKNCGYILWYQDNRTNSTRAISEIEPKRGGGK